MASNDSKVVAVGESGNISVSLDGVMWSASDSKNDTARIEDVVWTGTMFVAVAKGGLIFVSQDAKEWANYETDSPWLMRVVWADTQLVAVGINGVFTSHDAKTWTKQNSDSYCDIAWNGSALVAVSNSFDKTMYVSNDKGNAWTTLDSNSHGTSNVNEFNYVTWTGTKFVAVGYIMNMNDFTKRSLIYSSPDGVVWQKDTLSQDVGFSTGALGGNGLAYFSGKLIAIAHVDEILTSADGLVWTKQTSDPNGHTLACITEFKGKAMVGGYYGSLLTSPDGITWKNASIINSNFIKCASNGTTIIAVAQDYFGGTGSVFRSTDGILWEKVNASIELPNVASPVFTDINWSGGTFVAVGGGLDSTAQLNSIGIVSVSSDGEHWSSSKTQSRSKLNGVSRNGSLWISVGDSGVILKSSNDTTWTALTSGVKNSLKAVCSFGSKTVAVGDSGAIVVSQDNSACAQKNSNSKKRLNAACAGSGMIAAVGDSGEIVTSSDGETWTPRVSGVKNSLQDICWTDSNFVAVGDNGCILVSLDGLAWTKVSSPSTQKLSGIGAHGNVLVTVGAGGTILTSPISQMSIHNAGKGLKHENGWNVIGNKIYYSIRSSGKIEVKVFGLNGRMIWERRNENASAGTGVMVMPCRLLSGCYLISFKAGDHTGYKTVVISR
jgi:hypothetical protein